MTDVPNRLYLAGPMSGLPQHNFPLFNRVAAHLRARGHAVFNPAENKDDGSPQSRAYYMRLDIPALIGSEAVVTLPAGSVPAARAWKSGSHSTWECRSTGASTSTGPSRLSRCRTSTCARCPSGTSWRALSRSLPDKVALWCAVLNSQE